MIKKKKKELGTLGTLWENWAVIRVMPHLNALPEVMAAVKQPPNLHYPDVATIVQLPKGGGGDGTVAHAVQLNFRSMNLIG